jgi:hypothetical protein
MIHIGIDPGPTETAFVIYDTLPGCHVCGWKLPNEDAVKKLTAFTMILAPPQRDSVRLHIEMIASYGMPVGKEVFETCVWIGHFMEIQPSITDRLTRMMVKTHLCHSAKANDSNIRQALIDCYGGKDKAIGKKATPGPLYGLNGDMWAALAVAKTAAETTLRYEP